MKKIILLFSFAIATCAANAQSVTLSGSSYTQNFDALASGLPTGWECYIESSASFIGSISTFNSAASFGVYDTANALYCANNTRAHGFKNYPSADVAHALDTCGTQMAYTNRALGVRQVSNTSDTGYDPGVSFVLSIANTKGISSVNLSFKLQSLDITSPRTTPWTVDYAVGTPTTFTPATAVGHMITGGNTFFDSSITVNFGSALDNKAQPVWIRVVSLVASSGSGNRASSAIDDYTLTWTGTPSTAIASIPSEPKLSLSVLGNATSDKIVFGYSVEQEADYAFTIYDMTGRILHSAKINAQTGFQQITVDGLHLAPGIYVAKMSNGNSSSVARIMVN